MRAQHRRLGNDDALLNTRRPRPVSHYGARHWQASKGHDRARYLYELRMDPREEWRHSVKIFGLFPVHLTLTAIVVTVIFVGLLVALLRNPPPHIPYYRYRDREDDHE